MNPDLWDFHRASGHAGAVDPDEPAYAPDGALIFTTEVNTVGATTVTTAATTMDAHWNQLRMRPRLTGYSGHFIARGVQPGKLLRLYSNEQDSFALAVSTDDLLLTVFRNGTEINRAIPVAGNYIDVRWRVSSAARVICNGTNLNAGNLVHTHAIAFADVGGTDFELLKIYLVDQAVSDAELEGWT